LEKLILAQRSLIKTLTKRGPKVEPCGPPDNAEQGEEDFPTKEDPVYNNIGTT
jgi:hypothetical protein